MTRLVAALACSLLAAAALAAEGDRSLTVGGATRTYRLHLPHNRVPTEPVPLVVVFHGGGGNAAIAARMSGMDAKSDREGFIAAYPNGTGPRIDLFLTWNTWRCCGAALDRNTDDVGFTRAMVEALVREYRVDRKRIYATGMSNGGMMAYRVGCEMSDVFAAIAPVAGALDTDDCKPASPVSVIAFHGTADPHVRFAGGAPEKNVDRHQRVDNSVAFALDFWKQRDQCDLKPTRSREGRVIRESYACPEGLGVELYAIEGQGHAWPPAAPDAMWEFFERHPKR